MNHPTSLVWHDLQSCLRRTPRHLLEALKKANGTIFVAGGFIRSCIAHEEVNDIDCFAQSKELARAFALNLANGEEAAFHETDNAFTVIGGSRRLTIQVIHRWTFQNPYECINSFDFTIACAALWWVNKNSTEFDYTIGEWQSRVDERFYADLAAKRLIYRNPVRNEDAGGSILRVLKFYQRGYRIPLDSLSQVIARLVMGIENPSRFREGDMAIMLAGLLREVDPAIDVSHVAYLPAEEVVRLSKDEKKGGPVPDSFDP